MLGSFILPAVHLDFSLFSPGIIENNILPGSSMNILFANEMNYSLIIDSHLSIMSLLGIIYLIGFLVMMARLTTNFFRLYLSVQRNPIIKMGQYIYVLTDGNKPVYSFFHFIFFDRQQYCDKKISEMIIDHEKVHSRQLHSLDLIFAELYTAFLWFSPFAFFHNNSIKVNHEFQADFQVLEKGDSIPEYIRILANEAFGLQIFGFTSNFNCSIKKRLTMITKIKSSKQSKYRFLFLLPLLAIMLYIAAKPGNPGVKQDTSENTSANIPSICPIEEKEIVTTSYFGWRVHPIYKTKDFHKGLDIQALEGTPIHAAADGIVTKREFAGEGKGPGRYIVIKHSKTFLTVYTQLSEFKVNLGDKVKKGYVIGLVGHSGLSTGPHLHYEVIKDGKNVDPKDYFK
jgi:hypothetical protein